MNRTPDAPGPLVGVRWAGVRSKRWLAPASSDTGSAWECRGLRRRRNRFNGTPAASVASRRSLSTTRTRPLFMPWGERVSLEFLLTRPIMATLPLRATYQSGYADPRNQDRPTKVGSGV